jgi:hypothetical protein
MPRLGKAPCVLSLLLLFATCAVAREEHGHGFPNLNGRWDFAVTTGDPQSQLNSFGQTRFSTYLVQTGGTLNNLVPLTTDTSECDLIAFNNVMVPSGTVDHRGHVKIVFNVDNGAGQSPFQYVFTGEFQTEGHSEHHALLTISGTYQKTAGGCTQGSLGTSHADGEFVATHFPDMNGTWAGVFDDATGVPDPPDIPATMNLTTLVDHSISGTITVGAMTNSSGAACFDGPITLTSGDTGSVAWGINIELFGQDKDGTQIFVFAFPTNPDGSIAAVGQDNPSDGRDGTVNDGTNRELDVTFDITGGPCDGFSGPDESFSQIHKHKNGDGKNAMAQRGLAQMHTSAARNTSRH